MEGLQNLFGPTFTLILKNLISLDTVISKAIVRYEVMPKKCISSLPFYKKCMQLVLILTAMLAQEQLSQSIFTFVYLFSIAVQFRIMQFLVYIVTGVIRGVLGEGHLINYSTDTICYSFGNVIEIVAMSCVILAGCLVILDLSSKYAKAKFKGTRNDPEAVFKKMDDYQENVDERSINDFIDVE